MTKQEFEFHCLEYVQLHKVIDDILKSMRDVIKYIFVFTGVSYAFLLSQISIKDACIPLNLQIATWVPTFLVILSIIGTAFWVYQIKIIRTYLHNLEVQLAASELGWEAFAQQSRKPQHVASWMVWTVLVVGTITLSWLIFPPTC